MMRATAPARLGLPPALPRPIRMMRAMSRMDRFRLLVATAGVVVVAGLVIGSSVSFADRAAEACLTSSAGTISMSNTPSGMSMKIKNMVPGDSHTGTVVIKNTGEAKGRFYLDPVDITKNSKGFAQRLNLVIRDGRVKIYDGELSGLRQKDLGTWSARESHTYTFTVTFPDRGCNKRGVGLDNALMGATTTAAFNWSAAGAPQPCRERDCR